MKRCVRCQVMLTEEERVMLGTVASARGLDRSALLRMLLHGAFAEYSKARTEGQRAALRIGKEVA